MIPLIVAEFESADEIHKIWNDETFILYNPTIPHYAIIKNKVYKLEENSHLEWTPFRDVDSSSFCEIELTQINDKDVADGIIRRYYE